MCGCFRFKTYDWVRVIIHGGLPRIMDGNETSPIQSMESLLLFLATLVGVRTNLCKKSFNTGSTFKY